ncbi:tetratricopeptide repeat protein [Actinomyces vulturis]|uniref:tetratricopeptide repeat protein n=1 Tax=Actinomyces vulturis TaxID=1857645 RepID=UPI0008345C8C|nr:tetratricopeptide repeat protein [Actinomyces vulturis]
MSMFGAVDLSTLKSNQSRPGSGAGGAQGQQGAAGASVTAQGGAPTAGDGAGQVVNAPLIVDATTETFRQVMELSMTVPLIVDLWATWCEPCKQLGPILEDAVRAAGGKVQLVRVDVDKEPAIAQAFQAQSVPTVLAVIAGQPIPLFQGAVPAAQVRETIDRVLEVAQANGINGVLNDLGDAAPAEEQEPEESPVEREAREALERGDFAKAEEVYTRALNVTPGDESLRLAREQVRLMKRVQGNDPQALVAAADANPEDAQALMAGADASLAMGDVHGALGRGLQAVRVSAGDEREEARQRLLSLFDVIGAQTPEVAAARRQLASLLY